MVKIASSKPLITLPGKRCLVHSEKHVKNFVMMAPQIVEFDKAELTQKAAERYKASGDDAERGANACGALCVKGETLCDDANQIYLEYGAILNILPKTVDGGSSVKGTGLPVP